MTKLEIWQLRDKQALSLDEKVELSKLKIQQYMERLDGGVYVAFSGGKDSTVLLDLVRQVEPDTPACTSIVWGSWVWARCWTT